MNSNGNPFWCDQTEGVFSPHSILGLSHLERCGQSHRVWPQAEGAEPGPIPPCHRVGSVVLFEGSTWDRVGPRVSGAGVGGDGCRMHVLFCCSSLGQFTPVFGYVCLLKLFIKHAFPCFKGVIGHFLTEAVILLESKFEK